MLLRVLLFWLVFYDSLAALCRWQGLRWSPLLPIWARGVLLWLLGPARGESVWYATAALPALAPHVALASLRNPHLDPLHALGIGAYPGYHIDRVEIALDDGYVPALHLVPQGGAPAAVCVAHGSGCDRTSYAWRLAETLRRCGVAVLLIDLDGHGENPRPQRFPQMLDNIHGSVAWLRQRYTRVGVLGVSLGGCLAARAIADGAPADALAVLESPPLLHFTRADMWREGAGLVQPRLLGMFAETTAYQLYHGWRTAPIRAQISTWDLIAACDLTGSLARIQQPLLLLYGTRDAIVPPRQAAQVRAAAPPQARFRFIRGASHLTMVLMPQTQREVARWVREMLLADAAN